jgi:hypothetical protein
MAEFLEAVRVAFDNAGRIVPWPLHVARIAPYYADIEAADLLRRARILRERGRTPADLAALYPSASSAKSLMLDLIPGMKDAALPAADRTGFVTTIFTGLAEIEHGDAFCRDGTHRIMSDVEAQRLVDGPCWTEDRALASAAFGLSGAAQSLVWSMHFYGWTDICFVIHGPYRVTAHDGTPATLVVRDFFDLDPGELWPQLPEPPCRTIRLATVHDHSDEFGIDIFNHLLHRNALLSSTRAVHLSVDDRELVSADEASGLRGRLVELVRQQKTVVDGMSEHEVATKFVESRYYAFRGWRTALGDDWRPPAEVYQRLQTIPLPPDPPADDGWDALRDVFDPRLDWPAPPPDDRRGTP